MRARSWRERLMSALAVGLIATGGSLVSLATASTPAEAATPAVTVSGTVTSPSGPVEGAKVTFFNRNIWASPSATTDADGHYSANVTAAGTWTVRVIAVDGSPLVTDKTSYPVVVPDSGTTFDVAMVVGGRISGTVSGPTELYGEGFHVNVSPYDLTGWTVYDSSYYQATPNYLSKYLRPGSYQVGYELGSSMAGFPESQYDHKGPNDQPTEVIVRAGEITSGIDGVLTPPVGTHRVKVTLSGFEGDEDSYMYLRGTDASAEDIEVVSPSGTSARYVWLADGTYTVHLRKRGVELGTSNATFTISGADVDRVIYREGVTPPATDPQPSTGGSGTSNSGSGSTTGSSNTTSGSTATAPTTAASTSSATPPTADVANPAVQVSQKSATAGDSITVGGGGFSIGEQVEVWVHSTPVRIGTFTADRSGAASGQITLPSNLPAGVHHIRLVGASSGVSIWSNGVTVASSGSGLASTGFAGAPVVPLGIGAIVLGLLIAWASSRRRATRIWSRRTHDKCPRRPRSAGALIVWRPILGVENRGPDVERHREKDPRQVGHE